MPIDEKWRAMSLAPWNVRPQIFPIIEMETTG